MSFQSLLLTTFGLIFACVVFALLFKYLYSKLYTLTCCFGKSSSMANTVLSSNGNLGSQHPNADLSPPPSYDEVVVCGDIFVINIEGDWQYDASSSWHDEQLPTYDDATMGSYIPFEGKFSFLEKIIHFFLKVFFVYGQSYF